MFRTNIHPASFTVERYESRRGAVCAAVEMHDGTASGATVFLASTEACDELIKAARRAKSMLLGETSEPAGDAR